MGRGSPDQDNDGLPNQQVHVIAAGAAKRELLNRGVPTYWAERVGTTRKGPWRLSGNTTVAKALPVAYFTNTLGLVLPG